MFYPGLGIRFNLELDVSFLKQLSDDTVRKSFDTEMTILLPTDELSSALSYHSESLVQKIEKFLRNGSGWGVDEVHHIAISISE